jgi:cyclophilin family peptidyl-prolyl cis-trans isomerase
MARHKAATAVTIAPTEEKSSFALFVDAYWKLAAALALVVSLSILGWVYLQQRTHATSDETWSRLSAVLTVDPARGFSARAEELVPLAKDLKGSDAGAWALYRLALASLEERHYDQGKAALADLRATYPSHMLVSEVFPIEAGATPTTVADRLERLLDENRAFDREHEWLLANPAPPAGSPRVRIQTDKGDIVVALYANEAPKHVENFLKLAGEGFYDGIRFHRVVKDFMIQAGDPNSRDDDRGKWGQGGPGYGVEREESTLLHFEGVLAAAKPSFETQSSGSQFYITTKDRHDLDGKYVVYGTVLEGMDVVQAIAAVEISEGTENPVDPPKIVGTTVL